MNLIDFIKTRIGYEFIDIKLLELALTHKSFSKNNNERLEFFGDSILSMMISELLINQYPDHNEGQLSLFRASIVNRDSLNELARSIELKEIVILGSGESVEGTFIEGNTFEALIAAIYCDSGFTECKEIVRSLFKDQINNLNSEHIIKDPKTLLQELLQQQGLSLPIYETIDLSSSSDFKVACLIKDHQIEVYGQDSSIKKAQFNAAQKALNLLQDL